MLRVKFLAKGQITFSENGIFVMTSKEKKKETCENFGPLEVLTADNSKINKFIVALFFIFKGYALKHRQICLLLSRWKNLSK